MDGLPKPFSETVVARQSSPAHHSRTSLTLWCHLAFIARGKSFSAYTALRHKPVRLRICESLGILSAISHSSYVVLQRVGMEQTVAALNDEAKKNPST